jgi:hypothetical protein
LKKKKKSLESLSSDEIDNRILDAEFMAEIWQERPHIDFETGEKLYGEPLKSYFHHVLEKEQYPQFRYEKWNIVLVSVNTHSQCHTNMDFCPKIKEYREKLIKEKL